MSKTVYLVSGANRGIGLAFVQTLVQRDNAIVFAGARDPSQAESLNALVQKYPGRLHVVKLISVDEEGNRAAIEEIREKAGRLDVVIANAGISKYYGSGLMAPAQEMRDHYEINVIGTLVLFQASYPLLKASTQNPKFILISSGAGSISTGSQVPVEMLPYGASKAAENYLARKLHFENEGLIVFPICPGGVETDTAKLAIDQGYFKGMPLTTPEETVANMLPIIDNATRPEAGPVFHRSGGGTYDW